jgi:hypothetical protein
MMGFDWSSLDRNYLTQLFWETSSKIVGQELPIKKIHSIISTHIKKHLPIRVVKHRDDNVDFGFMYIGGCYYSCQDYDNEMCIELILSYNPFEDKLNITRHRFKQMSTLFADTVLHEIIHMRQFRRRDFKQLPDYASTAEKREKRDEQKYLGNSDEIDAYAFNAACELVSKFPDDHNSIVKYLNIKQSRTRGKINTWQMYLKAFEFDHDHRIIQRFKKKIIRYLPYADLGKPYRDRYWINL